MWCVYDLWFFTWSKAVEGAIMIDLHRLMSASFLVVVLLLVFANHGFGQSLAPAQTALDNAAAAGTRSPGNMVSAGVAQHQEFGGHVTVITEPGGPPEVEPFRQAIVASLEVLFEQLNQALLLFHNLILARAGRPPALGLKAVRIEDPQPGNLVGSALLQAKARRSLR